MDKDKAEKTNNNVDATKVDNVVAEALPDANPSATNNAQVAQQTQVKAPVKKRFQVDIFDQITYGEPPMEQIKLEKVHYDNPVIIEATCKKDLQDFAEKLALCKQTFKIVKVLDDVPMQQTAVQHTPQIQQNVQQPQVAQVRQKPKYYKVGDIELKDDNGKIYQKQWLRLTDAEASNFRIINDKTNSIFNLKDRHIEMKKWVQVDSTDETTDLEESLK